MNSSVFTLVGITLVSVLLLVLLVISSKRQKRVQRGAQGFTESASKKTEDKNAKNTWFAENLLEERLEGFRNNEVSRSAVRSAFLAAEVYVLSRSDGALDPYDCTTRSGARGSRLIPVYSSLKRLKKDIKLVSSEYSHVHTLKVRDWILDLPSDYGLVVNPTLEYTFELLPEDVAQIKFEMS